MYLLKIYTCKMILLYIAILIVNSSAEENESPLFSLKRRLVDYYTNPPDTGSEVLCSAVFYLHELTRLQEALAEKTPHQQTAKDLLVKLDEDGGPKHLNKIPYNKFIDKYTWEGEEISNYHTIVTHTRRVWDELRVQELGKEEVFTGPEEDENDD